MLFAYEKFLNTLPEESFGPSIVSFGTSATNLNALYLFDL